MSAFFPFGPAAHGSKTNPKEGATRRKEGKGSSQPQFPSWRAKSEKAGDPRTRGVIGSIDAWREHRVDLISKSVLPIYGWFRFTLTGLIKVAVSLVFPKRDRFEGLVVLGGFTSVGGNLLPNVPKQQGRGRTTFLWPEGSGFRCCPGLVPFFVGKGTILVSWKKE